VNHDGLSVCLSVCLSFCCGKQKRWIRSKKKKPNQNRADHTFGGPLGKPPTTTESLAVKLDTCFCFCSCSVHGTDSGRQPSRPRGSAETTLFDCLGQASCLMSYTHITIRAPLRCTPSHHIRASSLSLSTPPRDPRSRHSSA